MHILVIDDEKSQRDILQDKTPGVPGLQIVAKSKPATEVGGDSFNIITSKKKTKYINNIFRLHDLLI